MVQKRPFDDEEQYEISSKLPKQLKHNDQLPLFSEINPSEDGRHAVDATGEGGFKDREEVHEKFAGDHSVNPPVEYEEDTDYSEEDVQLHEPFHVSFFPEYFYPERGVRTLTRHEDIYSLHLQHPPLKPVPIGLNYQADIPAWNPNGAKESSSDFCSSSEVLLVYENKDFSGDSVIPMPDTESSQDEVGAGRSECRCHDKGSIRCVRQHIVEARDKLKRSLGTETFEDLGFLDMGEQVAGKWTEEEEQLFHEVVFANQPSIGGNFWNILSSAFPSRTKREIVSYYFNVFMLRRRAEQNRFDPLNADSDNDEWRASDEDDDDSVVESPDHHVGVNNSLEDDVNEYDEDAADETYDNENLAFETVKKGYEDEKDHITSKLDDRTWDDRGDRDHQEAQDDSCTSFDNGAASASSGAQLKDENQDRWPSSYNGLNNGSSGHDYGLEPCDAKLWDVGYVSCPKRDVDFLPTCSMIEEVFGDGSWNCKMDGKGPSF
ncbi:uncharacterized protein LOC116187681 [Punica granatum]|uniref:Myb-like domain-containing protein n=2 Tax=Punica granatum TaxID=22663 RepID=A0A218Y008_PUNGR|nr:uncharacterized protein LOC116187681 [Punica granatum]XP_031372432.1 uncharacterized protein LOC116187681 [Punica granatum]OWM90388.1 hypothetical protein CDL15_Pgr014690 [Punica granatum]PKI77959.1 hypothetical protein CRG98_001579 [Punica granatum]